MDLWWQHHFHQNNTLACNAKKKFPCPSFVRSKNNANLLISYHLAGNLMQEFLLSHYSLIDQRLLNWLWWNHSQIHYQKLNHDSLSAIVWNIQYGNVMFDLSDNDDFPSLISSTVSATSIISGLHSLTQDTVLLAIFPDSDAPSFVCIALDLKQTTLLTEISPFIHLVLPYLTWWSPNKLMVHWQINEKGIQYQPEQ